MKPVFVNGCKQPPGVIVPIVSLERCEGKGDCVTACPVNVFTLERVDTDDYRNLNLLHRLKLRVHGMQVAHTPVQQAASAAANASPYARKTPSR